jgi:hypothetical protein
MVPEGKTQEREHSNRIDHHAETLSSLMRGVLKDTACTANLLFGRRRGRRRKESALNMLISSTRSLARTYTENLFCLSYEGLEDCVAVLGVDGKNATPAKKAESIKLLCGSMSVHIQKFCCVHSD